MPAALCRWAGLPCTGGRTTLIRHTSAAFPARLHIVRIYGRALLPHNAKKLLHPRLPRGQYEKSQGKLMEDNRRKRLLAPSFIAATVVLLGGCPAENTPSAASCDAPDIPHGVTPVNSGAELECYLKTALHARYATDSGTGPDDGPDDGSPEVSASTAGDSSTTEYSGTNVQEAGVDEADWVKSDGQHLYILKQGASVADTGAEPIKVGTTADIAPSYDSSAILRVMAFDAPGPGASQIASRELAMDAGSMYLLDTRTDGRPPILVLTSKQAGW